MTLASTAVRQPAVNCVTMAIIIQLKSIYQFEKNQALLFTG
jgi:hypothetical protein